MLIPSKVTRVWSWTNFSHIYYKQQEKPGLVGLLKNSILCTKGVKCAFLDRVWSLQYESKASKHEPKASAFCEPKTRTATTRGQRAHLALGAQHIFCNTSIVFRILFHLKRSLYAASSGQRATKTFFASSGTSSGQKNFFTHYSLYRAFFTFYCPRVYKRPLLARIIGPKNAKNVLVWQKNV